MDGAISQRQTKERAVLLLPEWPLSTVFANSQLQQQLAV